MNSIRIDILPQHLQNEIQDYYEFLIAKYNIKKEQLKKERKRPYALAKDEFKIPDSFNKPLPDDLINQFYR